MLVNAVSSYSKGFTGKSRENIDGAIAEDDRNLREFAYKKAMHDVKDDKHKKISRALWASIPVAAGIATAALTKGKVSVFGKEFGGRASKLVLGIAGALPWAFAFGTIDAVVAAKNLAVKKSETVRNADNKHPILSFAALIATGAAALTYLPKAGAKLLNKMGSKTFAKLGKYTENIANVINKPKTPKFITNTFDKLAVKTPSAIKEGAKFALSVSPWALLATSFLHNLNHNIDARNEYNKNYVKLKDTQFNLAKARLNELKLENDFLKQTPENKEDLEVLENPLKDMPEEVVEKIQALKAEAED